MKYSKDKLDLDQVLVALKSKHFDDSKSIESGEGLYVHGGVKGRNGSKGKGRLGDQGKKLLKDVECFYCHELGHYIRDCPKLDKKRRKGNGEVIREVQRNGEGSGEAAVIVQESEGYETADLLVAEAGSVAKGDEWVMDSGCSHHMSHDLSGFVDLRMGSFGKVKLGSSKVCSVRGIGSVCLKLDDGGVHVLKGVRYVPELRKNLVSIGVLDGEGCGVSIKSGLVHVFQESRLILSGKKVAVIYVLNGGVMSGASLSVDHEAVCDDIAALGVESVVPVESSRSGHVQVLSGLSSSGEWVSTSEPSSGLMRSNADGQVGVQSVTRSADNGRKSKCHCSRS